MLHQGPAVHSVDFILPVFADHPFRDMHRKLAANCLAQASSLMRGKSAAEVRVELQAKGLQGAALEAAIGRRMVGEGTRVYGRVEFGESRNIQKNKKKENM